MSDLINTQNKIYPSYSYREFSENEAQVIYYLSRAGSSDYSLVTNTNATGNLLMLNLVTTILFKMSPTTIPRIITGDVIFIPALHNSGGDSVGISCKVQLVSGGTTTDISSAVSSNTATGNAYRFVKIPVTTTKIKKGDYIQISVARTAADTTWLGICPRNITWTGATYTDSKLIVSYKLF